MELISNKKHDGRQKMKNNNNQTPDLISFEIVWKH